MTHPQRPSIARRLSQPALRALAAWNGKPLRLALSRVIDPLLARPAPGSPARIGGPVTVNPSGTVLKGRSVVGRAAGAGTTDWLVQAFPSPLSPGAPVLPLGYGANPTVVTLLTEALPAALWLDNEAGEPNAVILMGLALARLNATQEALSVRLFAHRRVRPHAAHRVATAPAALLPPQARLVAHRASAGKRLADVFGISEQQRPLILAPLSQRRAGLSATALAATAPHAVLADPFAIPVAALARSLAGATALVTTTADLAPLASLVPHVPHLAAERTDLAAAGRWLDDRMRA